MGHFVTSNDIPKGGEQLPQEKFKTAQMVFGGIGAIGFLASIIVLGFGVGGEELQGGYAYSWLFALAFFITISIGGCFWVLLHNMTNASWGVSVRRVMENVGFVYPFIFIFALPLLFPPVQEYLYEWMTAEREASGSFFDFSGTVAGFYGVGDETKSALNDMHHALLTAKSWYLNSVAWYVRYIFYGVGLSLVIYRLRKFSADQDNDPKPTTERLFKARGASAWGIPILGLTITFLAIDWMKSLNYTWFSTMWGVYMFAGSLMASMATIILTTRFLKAQGYLQKLVTDEHFHIMGKLMHAFVIFWAYISFSQFMLIWYSNIPEETMYFALRNTEEWHYLSLTLVFGHFALPFLLLLPHWAKKKAKYNIVICIFLLVMHACDMYHIVIPQRGPSLSNILHMDNAPLLFINAPYWIGDILAWITIGSGFMFFLLRNLKSVNLYPNQDPRILESANMTN